MADQRPARRAEAVAAREAAETGITKLNPDQAKAVLKAKDKGVNFADDVSKGLNKVGQDDLGVRWIKDLGATGKAALDASDNLTMAGARAVQKAFKDAGMPDISVDDAARISGATDIILIFVEFFVLCIGSILSVTTSLFIGDLEIFAIALPEKTP